MAAAAAVLRRASVWQALAGPPRRALGFHCAPALIVRCAPRRRHASTVTDPVVQEWGRHPTTSVTLRDLKEIGLDPELRRRHGVFLHRELRIRIAQRVLELQALPYNLAEREGIRDVIRWYTDFVLDLEFAQVPASPGDDEEFTHLLTAIFEDHTEVIQAMATGVQDLMREMGEDYEEARPQVDSVLRRFFTARIGMRFLIQHHINSLRNREGHSGILQLECSPAAIARKAAKDSEALCRAHLGQAPRIIIRESGTKTFTYVPMHIQYMLCEVFKNACRATVEQHADDGFDDILPPVQCHIVHGYEDVTLKISDEGGGMSRERQQDVWKFMYSTYKRSPWQSKPKRQDGIRGAKPLAGDSLENPLQRQKPGGVLAGYGVGLSLGRLYAQYFGGELVLTSMDGYGTDVYLHLSRLGNYCENLPQVVLSSPSMRDSSVLEDDADDERLLISADEEAFLRQELAQLRRSRWASSL